MATMPQVFYDDEGNSYTPEQLRAASDAQVKDESGQGSFGGFTEPSNYVELPPDQRPKQTTPTSETAPEPPKTSGTEPAGEPGKGTGKSVPKRELNPAHFGDFLKSNVFGGANADYVLGKRPETLFDLGTDVLQSYGGMDLTKRNASLVETDLKKQSAARESAKFDTEQEKAKLDIQKQLGQHFADTFENYDSDLWQEHLSYLAKQSGVQFPPASIKMAGRMADAMHEAGVHHPQEVLDNPDKYPPELVNRVRFTLRHLSEHAYKGQQEAATAESGKAAAGIKKMEETGIRGAADAATTPGQRNAVLAGGAPRSKVMEAQAGLGGGELKTDVQQRRAAAIENLTKSLGRAPTESEILTESQKLGGEGQATAATAKAEATSRAEMKTNADTLLRTFSDPALDHAITNSLVSAPGGGGIFSGAAAVGKTLLNKPGMYLKGRAGDPDVKTLQTLPVEAIMPIIRSAGSKGFRITQSEINSFGSDAQRLASGSMGQEEARAFRDHWVKRALQIKQYAETGKQPEMTPQEKSIVAQMIKREAGSIGDPGQRAKYIQQELQILKGA